MALHHSKRSAENPDDLILCYHRKKLKGEKPIGKSNKKCKYYVNFAKSKSNRHEKNAI